MEIIGKETKWLVQGEGASLDELARLASAAAPAGQDALKLDVSQQAPLDAVEQRTWPVIPGRAYKLSAQVKTALDRAYGQLRLKWLDADGREIGVIGSPYAFCDHDFAPVQLWGVAPQQAAFAQASLLLKAVGMMGRTGAGGSLWLSPAVCEPSLLVQAKPAAPGAIFNTLKPVEYGITLSGAPADLEVVNLTYKLVDYDKLTVHEGSVSPRLKGGKAKLTLSLPALPYGYYELTLQTNTPELAATSNLYALGSISPLDFEPPADYAISLDAGMSWPCEGGESNMGTSDEAGRLAVQTAACKRLGLRALRDRMSWSQVNPEAGVFDWGKYQRAAEAQKAGGIDVYQVFHDVPGWTLAPSDNTAADHTYPPRDLRSMYVFGQRLAKDLGHLVRYFEFWNEPDGGFFSGHPWDMAAITKAGALGIRDADPTIGLLSASRCTGPEFWRKWLSNGAGAYVDIFNQHSYGKPEDQFALHAQDRELLAQVGLQQPIWMTEMGMRGSPSPDGSYTLAEHIQVSYLLRSYACGLASGIDRFHFFYLQEFLEYGMHLWGVQRADLSPKPAFIALSALIRQIGLAKVVGYLQADDSYCIVFERKPQDYVGLAWSNINSLVQTGWAATLPMLEPGQDWAQADGYFDLPLVRGAYLADAIGRRTSDLEGDSVHLKLSLAPVFVRGLDVSRMTLTPPAPTPHFVPSETGFSREKHVFLQAVTRPSQPRLEHSEAQRQKNALDCADGQAEELALVVHNYTDAPASVSVSLWLPQGWSLDKLEPSVGCEANGAQVLLLVAPQSSAEIRASYTANGLKAGEECMVTAQLYFNGAPQDQTAVYYKGI
ncbi:MAG: glycoside hydrolase family protein [Chloroflexi bacterium]|nr:glycoside hydrolase family protein [Chloroflexota bacterium]